MAYVYYTVILKDWDTGDIPPGYLFMCPLHDLISGSPGSFKRPDQMAYWSLDPSGVERLSSEEAAALGFPELILCADVWQEAWDETTYAGLRKFHAGKGFDSDSQDVARDQGFPLYQLTADPQTLFAYGENTRRLSVKLN
jgi:hypothetical protein